MCELEAALALIQAVSTTPMWLLTRKLPRQRAGMRDLELEVIVSGKKRLVPRLKTATSSFDGAVRLSFHSRGAVRNLYLEPQPSLTIGDGFDVVLSVRAVGLNFRDVLNVLGEYPGDPGPPGGHTAGTVTQATDTALQAVDMDVVGLAHADRKSVV